MLHLVPGGVGGGARPDDRPARGTTSSNSSRPGLAFIRQQHQQRAAGGMSSVRTPVEGWWVPTVGTRCVVEVSGRDATSFLQGLTTNDLHQLHQQRPPAGQPSPTSPPRADGEGRACFAAFLTPGGRVLADALISRTTVTSATTTTLAPEEEGGEERFLVECDKRAGAGLLRHLGRYRLRAKVRIRASSDMVTTSDELRPASEDSWRVGALLLPPRHVHPSGAQGPAVARRWVEAIHTQGLVAPLILPFNKV